MMIKPFLLLVAIFAIACGAPSRAVGQSSPATRERPNKIVYEGDLAALLSTLAEKYNVNIGLETVHAKPNVKIDTWFGTLDDILDAIVAAAPGYQWRSQDGFIDVYPKEMGCPLLETLVGEFKVVDNDWGSAIGALTNLQEVQSQMNVLRLRLRDLTNGVRKTDDTRFSLTLEGVTLRRALHEVAKKSSSSFWVFRRYGSQSSLFSIANSG